MNQNKSGKLKTCACINPTKRERKKKKRVQCKQEKG